ncbi:MAG: glycosyltransferase family 2 protein [Planctomycetes bacterium]|nr:glycosyltransferase family 2 protein [Planctomycetota bacterium]
MFVSITIQTYNRSTILAETLESLRSLRCPRAVEYEILVVDNNSRDDTQDVLRRYACLLAPRLRSVFESQQGLSHARNRALAEAKGEIVSFLDDDVVVDPGWLEAVCRAFVEYSATVVGGRSYLIYPEPPGRPAWLPPHREDMYSRLDHGPDPLVDTDKALFGLNFSVLRQKAIEAHGFDISLGRNGNKLACGEESDLLDRLRRAGGIAVYEPGAVVGHRISPDRLTRKWLLKRAYYGALATERARRSGGTPSEGARTILGDMLRCWGSVGRALATGAASPQELFEKQFWAVSDLGRFVASLRRHGRPSRPAQASAAG